MIFFCKKYSVCDECRVHFEPTLPSSGEWKWRHLCPVHRKPVMGLDRRRDMVVEWASRNWHSLETQMQEDYAKNHASPAFGYQEVARPTVQNYYDPGGPGDLGHFMGQGK